MKDRALRLLRLAGSAGWKPELPWHAHHAGRSLSGFDGPQAPTRRPLAAMEALQEDGSGLTRDTKFMSADDVTIDPAPHLPPTE